MGETDMQQIKLVALDLDGTVFNDEKAITPARRRPSAPRWKKASRSCRPPAAP